MFVIGALQRIYDTEEAALNMTEADVRTYLDDVDNLAYRAALHETFELWQKYPRSYKTMPEYKKYSSIIDLLHAKAAIERNRIKHAALRASATSYEQVRPKPTLHAVGTYDRLYELQAEWEQDAAAWRAEQAARATGSRFGYGFR